MIANNVIANDKDSRARDEHIMDNHKTDIRLLLTKWEQKTDQLLTRQSELAERQVAVMTELKYLRNERIN